MDEGEFAFWSEQNDRIYALSDRARSPCHDCIEPFALEMRALDRCDGEPCGSEDDEQTGQERSAQVRHAQRLHNIAVARNLSEMGLSQYAVARTMGVHRNTVVGYLRSGA